MVDGDNDGVGATRGAGHRLEQEVDRSFVPLTIDATFRGNVARFFNHACSPSNNLCKQKVFAAPYVTAAYRLAFFAARDIQEGEELTYDYEYEVGAVKGQPMVCRCGAPTCRGRLL
jgi:SET domain-containing protein